MFNIGISSVKVRLNTLGSTLALLNIGQSSDAVAASISSFTLSLASKNPILSLNSTIMIEKFSWEEEVIFSILFKDFNLSSRGSVISFSTSSDVLPG